MDFIQIWLGLVLIQACIVFSASSQYMKRDSPIIVAKSFVSPFSENVIPENLVGRKNWEETMNEPLGSPLDPGDFEIGIAAVPIVPAEDATLLAGLFQGDIIIPDMHLLSNLTAHTADKNPRSEADLPPRNAIINLDKRWTNGRIPYSISREYDTTERGTIAKAMAAFHSNTCIRFVPRSSENDYIHIAKSNGCSSAVGRVGGRQTVSLGNGCLYYGIVVHEFMHATGFWHEQSRADRDDYITIMWNNIQTGMDYNFQKYDWDIIQNLGVRYDTGSIMHYGANSFAKDRSKPTIIPRNNNENIGQRNHFSALDKKKLNILYQCDGFETGTGGGGGGGEIHILPPTTQKPFVTTKPIDQCTDSAQHCVYWEGIGECSKNAAWMNENCRKSCGQCGICQDNNKYCDVWRDRGECTKSAAYMKVNCRKSCGLCHKAIVPPPPTCGDENQYCTDWASLGECNINPDYMFQYCKKSCNRC